MRYVLLLCMLLSACSDMDKFAISDVLDARDQSISAQNIQAYALLMHDNYRLADGGETLQQMKNIFADFDEVKMTSRNREIRILNASEAVCEQTYVLKVLADGDWREIIQREQLKFTMVDGVWKISGGL